MSFRERLGRLMTPPSQSAPRLGKEVKVGTRVYKLTEERLGSGGYGQVYMAIDDTGKYVAAKLAMGTSAIDATLREVLVLQHLKDLPRICKLADENVAVSYNEQILFVMLELIPGTSLHQFIRILKARRIATLNERVFVSKAIVRLMQQLAETVRQINSRGITHNDLKPGNLMVTPDGDIVVIDFGLSCYTPCQPSWLWCRRPAAPPSRVFVDILQVRKTFSMWTCEPQRTTKFYCAPELRTDSAPKDDPVPKDDYDYKDGYDYAKVDAYSMAKILLEMATGTFQYDEKVDAALESGRYFESVTIGNSGLEEIIQDLAKGDCKARSSVSDVVHRLGQIRLTSTLPVSGGLVDLPEP